MATLEAPPEAKVGPVEQRELPKAPPVTGFQRLWKPFAMLMIACAINEASGG